MGLAAFAEKNFGKAGKLFNESANHKANALEEIKQKAAKLIEEVIRDFRFAGDAHYDNYEFYNALLTNRP